MKDQSLNSRIFGLPTVLEKQFYVPGHLTIGHSTRSAPGLHHSAPDTNLLSAMLPEGVVCRRATPEDQRAVTGISTGILYGLDYIDWIYPHYISRPDVHAYVLEKDGIIVSFMYTYLVDGDKSVVRGGGRTRDGHGGKKYLKILQDYSAEQLRMTLTQPARLEYMAMESTFHQNRLEKRKDVYTLLLRRNVSSYTFTLRNAMPSTERLDITPDLETWRPNEEEFTHLMRRKDTSTFLFPSGYFISNWSPYVICDENISWVYRTSVIRVSGNKADSQYSAISFNVHLLGSSSLVIHLDFSGDPACLMAHIMAVIQYLQSGQSCSNPNLHVTFLIYIPEEMDPHSTDALAQGLGWKAGPVGHNQKSILVAGPVITPYAKL